VIKSLEERLVESNGKVEELERTMNKLFVETSYMRTRERIN
jgi:hypothetical protein